MNKRKSFRPMPRSKITFEPGIDTEIHKRVSALRYGEEIVLPVDENYDLYVYAAKKSAYYNCMDDLKVILSKDKKTIKIYMEL